MKQYNLVISLSVALLFASCNSKAAAIHPSDEPQINPADTTTAPVDPVDDVARFGFASDTVRFSQGQSILLDTDANLITRAVLTTKPSGWKVSFDEKYNMSVTAPDQTVEGQWRGEIAVRATTDEGQLFRCSVFVTLNGPRDLKHYKVGFMGDSITDQWDNEGFHPEFFSENNYLNVGIGGETTNDMLVRFQKDIVERHPDIMVLCAGTNDIAENDGYYETDEEILGNLKKMCDMAREDGSKVLLCSIPPCHFYWWRPAMTPAARIVALNEKIKALVESEKYDMYVDYFTPMSDDGVRMNPNYTNDGCHPTNAGYKVMESIIQAAIAAVSE